MGKKQFKEQVAKGGFVEWMELAGNFYGTRKAEVEIGLLWEGVTPVLRMDPRGAWKLAVMCREHSPPFDRVNLITFMVVPPDRKTLQQRLLARDGGDKSDPDFVKRMRAVDEYELPMLAQMHFAVINYENEQKRASEVVEEEVGRYRT